MTRKNRRYYMKPVTLFCVLITFATALLTIVIFDWSGYTLVISYDISADSTTASFLNVTSFPERRCHEEEKTKTLLLWTWLYTKPDWGFGLGQDPFLEKCPRFNNCRTTIDKEELSSADSVLFFAFSMMTNLNNGEKLSSFMPRRGHNKQVYVFWNNEPSTPAFGPHDTLVGLEGAFNITVTYRQDSTIPNLPYVVYSRPRPTSPLPSASILSLKTDLVAWVVSACNKSHSFRSIYADALGHFLPLDIYGACGNRSCHAPDCFGKLAKRYKFYLAFENSYCRDYVTEKAFRTLQGDWVPIVLGGADYARVMPPHSFIDVRDFDSPKELAKYLLYLDKNDKEYMKYLEYKRTYQVARKKTHTVFCELCEMLHTPAGKQRMSRDMDIHEWWEESGCLDKKLVPKELHLEDYLDAKEELLMFNTERLAQAVDKRGWS